MDTGTTDQANLKTEENYLESRMSGHRRSFSVQHSREHRAEGHCKMRPSSPASYLDVAEDSEQSENLKDSKKIDTKKENTIENMQAYSRAGSVQGSDIEKVLEESFKFAAGIVPPHTSQSRRSHTQNKSKSPLKPKAHTSHEILKLKKATSFEVPEEVLLRDVLYALQGIDSRYVKFDATKDRFEISNGIGVHRPMRELVYHLCELGWLYRKVASYLSKYRDNLAYGIVGQSFCHVLNVELTEYFRLIAVLTAQVDEDAEVNAKEGHQTRSELTLRKVLTGENYSHKRKQLMRTTQSDNEYSVEGLRGGNLVSGIHSHVFHGDPAMSSYIEKVMKRISRPIFRMIRRWVFEGELEDAHHEFFVSSDKNLPDDQLWAHQYKLQLDMLPTFISLDLANQILIIGKSINFIRQCCGNTEWVLEIGKDTFKANAAILDDDSCESDSVTHGEIKTSQFAEVSRLEKMIYRVSLVTNEYLTRLLVHKFHLLEHCQALKSYMLLGQGDFIQHLMDLLGPELSQRATQIYRHRLRSVFETALNASNAKFESSDVSSRLDVQLLQASAGETGWDIFSLHYKLTSPINTVIDDIAMLDYQRIFHFLWRLKRVEYLLSGSWSKDMNLGHLIQNRLPGILSIIHSCQLLRSEMIHFTRNLLSYMMFEVLETSWHKLVKDLQAAKDLDKFIGSHKEYIETIKEHAFMTEDSAEILAQLTSIFTLIIHFCEAQEHLYTSALREVQELRLLQQAADRRALEVGQDKVKSTEEEQHDLFGSDSKLGKQIDEMAAAFRTQFRNLQDLIRVKGCGHQGAPYLVFRFDFNEFYQGQNTGSNH
uniref:Gammatubulin complex component putative n=1 Tax=Albugo laibachii Nc14 TaxID=890382 RepID=F0W1F1_9STRA|nr:gammatubulin complex component putative [Albugo laibachii Nc14]|eukprot:CCA14880.1 gammatubulin complex component putative [Albugo laibachii Nc14]